MALTIHELFNKSLLLREPWVVDDCELFENKLSIWIKERTDAKHECPVCGQAVPVLDRKTIIEKYLYFFQYECYLHCRLPKLYCPQDGVQTAFLPWKPCLESERLRRPYRRKRARTDNGIPPQQ